MQEKYHLQQVDAMKVSAELTRRTFIGSATPAVFACGLASARLAAAQSVETFYAGRTVTLIVPFGPGAYYDLGARLIARHLGEHIPGKPRLVVENQPNAGGIGLANRFAFGAQNDGSVIGVVQRAVPQYALIDYQSVKFDPLKLAWIGSLSAYATDAYVLLINAKTGIKALSDLQKPGMNIKLGAGRSGSANLIFALVARDLFKLNFDIVRGYEGTAPIFLALRRGEVDGLFADWSTVKASVVDLWTSHKVVALIQFGRKTRYADLTDVPTARELLHGQADRQLLNFAELPFFMALPVLAPSGVPADRLAALQVAFRAMASDPDLLKDSKKMNYPVDPIGGDAVRSQIIEAAATPADVIKKFKELIATS
jgi:tripartite-type tricarboxylate transporter receptor subunit TctC